MRLFRIVLSAICAVLPVWANADENSNVAGPFKPDVAAQKFVLPTGYQIDLVASEPHVIDPVALTFAPDGKLWVVEYSDYPNGPDAGEPGRSRIRVLEDQDGDGRYDSSKLFAEKLLFANGIMLWKDGVVVTTDGKVLFMRDTNGDGIADETQIWFEGFMVENPQLRCNHPTLGPDNLIYIANGLRGGQIIPGKSNPWKLDPAATPVSLSGMDFRFDPLTGKYEAISGMGQFGLSFDDWGNRYLCDNRHPCKQIILEDADIKRVPWLRPSKVFVDVSPAENDSKLFPLSRSWTTSNLHANQFTAACGVTIFRGTGLRSDYGNNFVCEPTANLVHRDILKPALVSYLAVPDTSESEFLATRDEWFRPVNLSVGPDGALYVCDMYRAVIEHPQFMPAELQKRPDLLLGNDMGRLWRVTSTDQAGKEEFSFAKFPRFDQYKSKDLVPLLMHPNQWQRETAQRLLLERQDASVVPELVALLSDTSSKWGGNLALWTLSGINQLTAEHVAQGFKHPYAMRSALQLARKHFPDLPAYKEFPQTFLAKGATQSADPHLFEQILINTSWKNFPILPANADPLVGNPRGTAILSIPDDSQHVWYCSLLVMNAGEELVDVCQEVFATLRRGEVQGGKSVKIGTASLKFLSGALARRNQPAEIERFLTTVLQPAAKPQERDWQRAALIGLLENLPGSRKTLETVLKKIPQESRQAYNVCLNELLASFLDLRVDAKLRLPELQLLSLLPAQEVLPVVTRLIRSNELDSVNGSIELLRMLPPADAVPMLLELVATGTPQVRRSAVAALSASGLGIQGLLDAVENKTLAALEIDPAISKRLMASKDEKIGPRATALLKQSPPEDRVKVLAEYASVLSMASDPKRGRVVFEKTCATCHKIGDLGVNVAPDISDSRTKTTDFLLVNILDPNRAIDNNYFSITIADTDGRVHTGVIASETSTAVTLKQPEGKMVTIPREEIDMMKNNGVSLMPVGLERTIPPQDMADLISFIKNWRYLDGQVPTEVIQSGAAKQ